MTGGYDRTVRLWNPARLDPAYPPKPNTVPRALPIQAYTDGITHGVTSLDSEETTNTLAVASEKNLLILDLVTKQVKRRFQGHIARINDTQISQGGETYVSASYDTTVKIWDGRSQSYDPIQSLADAKDSVTCVDIDQNEGNAIIRTASVDGKLRSYDIRQGLLKTDDCGSSITGLCLTKDGQNTAVSCLDGFIRLVDISSGELQNTYTGSHKAGQFAINCCVNASDSTIASGSEDGNVVLYDLIRATTKQVLAGHTRPTCSIAAHPSIECKSVYISASYDGTANVWAESHDFMNW